MQTSLDVLGRIINAKGAKGGKRSLKLLADFTLGYALNWYFCVPFFFHEALDIKFTERTNNKIKTKLWTQGSCFNFSEGDILHNHRYAYCKNFECSPNIMPMTLQIESSLPVIPQVLDKQQKVERERNPGTVNLKIFGLPIDWKGTKYHTMSQDEFILLLIKGPPEDWYP